ncbi:hypothetical protein Emag_006407 [Eimeria magna]
MLLSPRRRCTRAAVAALLLLLLLLLQEGSAEGFRLLDTHEAELQKARAVAEALGLDLIGLIFTHKSRDEFLTAQEAIFLAKLQLKYLQSGHFTGYPAPKFVACTVALQSAGETPEQQQDITPNAFMVSDLGELLPQVLEGGAERDRFDVHWAIVRAYFNHPSVSRGGAAAAGGDSSSSSSSSNNWIRFSDFHLLLYVANLFDLPTSLTLCEAVAKEGQVDPGIEDVLKSLG